MKEGPRLICNVGSVDLHQGNHRARCLDDLAQLCNGFTFQTAPEGSVKLEEHIFRDGANLIIALEPAGLPWLMAAVYLRSQRPDPARKSQNTESGHPEAICARTRSRVIVLTLLTW